MIDIIVLEAIPRKMQKIPCRIMHLQSPLEKERECACVRACVRPCVRAYVHARVCVCMCLSVCLSVSKVVVVDTLSCDFVPHN